MNAFDSRGIAFAIKTTAAALAAILVALWFDLPNPGWAGLTVFLTSQPLGGASGAVVGKAFYRVLGTLLAVAGILFVIPAFNGAPELLVGALAAWVALWLYVSLLDRSPRGYTFLLAAYTLPLVGMPLANNPANLFNQTVWRAEEIVLGGFFAIVVHTLFAPRTVKPVLVARAQAAVRDAQSWIRKGLGPRPVAEAERRARERVAAELAELRTLAEHLRFEPGVTGRDIAAVAALEGRLVALLPLLDGVEDRLAAIRASHVRPVERELVTGVRERLAELREAWNDARTLLAHLESDAGVPDERTRRLIADASGRALHVDRGLAALSGLAAAVAVVIAGGLCWVLGWDLGTVTIGIAAAGSSLFAFLDDPRPALRVLLLGSLLAVPVAALYVFGVLPALDGPAQLAVALAPLFFVTALYVSTPAFGVAAIGFALISQTLISVQSVQTGDFTSFTATAIGSILGTVIALAVMSTIRIVSAETGVRRLLRAAWRDLAAIADGTSGLSRAAWVSRMLDRVGLLLPRMAGATGVMHARAARAVHDLRLGANMVELRDATVAATPEVRKAVQGALAQIGLHFRQRLARPDAEPAPAVRESLERAIAALREAGSGSPRVQGLAAATGLRLGLFPPAAAPAAADDGAAP
jgi:uncharacterized membrane protein YccC